MKIKYVCTSGTQATGYVTECLQVCAEKVSFSISNDIIQSSSYNTTSLHNFLADYKPSASVNVCKVKTSGTQATAFINECLQVSKNDRFPSEYLYLRPPVLCNKHTTTDFFKNVLLDTKLQDVYFFGSKKDMKSDYGKTEIKNSCVSSTCVSKKSNSQTKLKSSLSSISNGKAKEVSIKDTTPCPSAAAVGNGNLVVTVSHIKIGPKQQLCPVFGNEPCIGPKCLALSERQGPVKVTTVTNSRRGVFELVVRRITGAPLATNELLLEWHPPPNILQKSTYRSHNTCCLPIITRPFQQKYKKKFKKLTQLIPCRSVSCKMSCCKLFCSGKSKQNPLSPCVRSFTKPPNSNLKCQKKRCLRPCPVINRFRRRKCSWA